MKTRTLLPFVLLLLIIPIFISASGVRAQTSGDELFNSALRSYVNKLIMRANKTTINRERFLVQQIRMINDEIKSRVARVSKIRENYFQRLQKELNEVRQLRQRLNATGANSINVFISEVETKIQETIDSGTIDFTRQKAIEDAVQLLHVAEEMIQMDPNARLEDNPKFATNFKKTKTEFVQTFGLDEGGAAGAGGSAGISKATIFDVYKEWKQTEFIKYQVRWTDIQVIKKRLLKKGGAAERERMFKRELRHAAEAFNFGFYDLAERSFAEIMRVYKNIGRLDDCLFYEGEANYQLMRYHAAQKNFEQFTADYPASPFQAKVYLRLMQIANHFENYGQALNYYNQMQSVLGGSNPYKDAMTFLVINAALHNKQYGKVAELAYEISSNSPYYRESRFVLAEAYAGEGQFEEANKIFKSLIENKGVEPNFRFTVLLKLGYIKYELGDYWGAIKYFDQIGGYYPNYDRVLIGYAWAYYKTELSKKKSKKRDFSVAKKYIEALLDNFYGSEYLLEARALEGYIDQLEENADMALDNYGYVFHAREVKEFSDDFNNERDRLRDIMSVSKRLEQKALEENKPAVFHKAYETRRKIRKPLVKLSYMDLSSSSVETQHEVGRLQKQLAELERLKKIARQRQNKQLVKRIETMQLKIYRAVNSVQPEKESKIGYNYFSEHPLARKESVVENKNKKVMAVRKDTQRQREEIASRLTELDFKIKEAKTQRNYRRMVQLELSKARLQDLAKKLDFLATQAYSIGLEHTAINLNKWADYGAFGMTNVRFALKNRKSKQIAEFQDQISQINNFLELRKENIEHEIEKINNEITLMTRRVREQERIRQREELKRQFEESYFDTHDTELNYQKNTTQPPKIEEH